MEQLQFEKFAIEEEGVFVSDYKIWDEKRTLIAEAKGKLFSKVKQVYFYNNKSKDVSNTFQIIKTGILAPEYHVVKDNRTLAVLAKQFKIFEKEFTVEIAGQGTMTLRGNLRKNNFVMIHNGVEIAKISRQRTLFTKDIYGTAIRADYDYRITLCLIIILDIIIDIERQSK